MRDLVAGDCYSCSRSSRQKLVNETRIPSVACKCSGVQEAFQPNGIAPELELPGIGKQKISSMSGKVLELANAGNSPDLCATPSLVCLPFLARHAKIQ